MLRRLAALAVVAALVPGCRAEGPAEAYRAFAAAVRDGDAKEVWSRLSKGSRDALDARAAALSSRTGGVTPERGVDLVLGDAALGAARLESVVVVRESAGAAELRVEVHGAGARIVSMAREDGRWRVVLPSVIQANP
jgi:hypothetical protein